MCCKTHIIFNKQVYCFSLSSQSFFTINFTKICFVSSNSFCILNSLSASLGSCRSPKNLTLEDSKEISPHGNHKVQTRQTWNFAKASSRYGHTSVLSDCMLCHEFPNTRSYSSRTCKKSISHCHLMTSLRQLTILSLTCYCCPSKNWNMILTAFW